LHGAKWTEREADNLLPPSIEVQNTLSFTSTT